MNTSAEATVHLVDDDDAVRDSLKILLESHRLEVCDYKSAADFLGGAGAGVTGCLSLDLHLPVLSGLDLIKILRQRKVRLPVIFITGRSDKEIKEQAIAAGAVAFLDKPVREEPLLAAIYAALGSLTEPPGRNATGTNVSAGRERQVPSPFGPVLEGFSPAFSP